MFENILDPIDDAIIEEEISEVQLPEEEIIYIEKEDEVSVIEDEIVESEESPIHEEKYEPKGKITLEDIKEIKERNRGFSVSIPDPRRNNFIQRIGRRN